MKIDETPLFDKPLVTKPKKLREANIEKSVCDYAKGFGIKVEKFNSPGRRSVPDRMFSLPGGFVFFIEFKAPGKEPTPKQIEDHKERKLLGFPVFVVDDVQEGKRIVDNMNKFFVGLLTRLLSD